MADDGGPGIGDVAQPGDTSGLASVIQIDRDEEIAAVCGRIDAAPTFAVVVHAPKGNRRLATELGIRRLQRHAEEAGKVVAIATGSGALASRARQSGIPVSRRPENIRWDSGGRVTLRVFRRTLVLPSVGRYAQGSFILLLALVFLVLAVAIAPAGSVVAYPPADEVRKVITIAASPDWETVDVEALEVPAQEVSTEQTITLAVRTTGTVPVPTKHATAILTLTNSSQQAVLVPAGSVLVAGPGDIHFELGAETLVAAGSVATQGATARVPGPDANVAAGASWRWEDARFQGLSVANAQPAAGGTLEPRPAVDTRDIASINALAQDLGRSETVRRILLEARPHDAVFLGTAETSIEPGDLSAPAGEPADILTLDVKIVVSALAVTQGTLEEVARSVLASERPGKVLIPGSVYALETGARRLDPEKNLVRTEIAIGGLFARDVTPDAVRDAVKGKSVSSAKSILASRYGIDDAEVEITPGWAPWLPRFGFRIDVEFRSRPPATTSNAEGSAEHAPGPTASSPAETPAPGP